MVNGDAGITGSLNVSGSITSNQTPNVHSLSGSLHISGGAGGVLHLSSSVADTPMIQFHQSASNSAVLLRTDEYGAGLWHVEEYSGANHNGHLIGQTFTTSTQDAIRIRGGGNGDNNVDHYLGQNSYMLTDLGDTTTTHAKIDSSGIHTSHSIVVDGNVTASSGATIGSTTTGSFTLSELNVIGTGLGLSLGATSGTAGIRLRDNRASNNSAVAQRSDGRLSLAGTENSWGSSGIEITSTGRVAVGGTTFGRNDGSLIERFLVHGSAGITGSLTVSGSITTNPLQTNSSASVAYLELTGSSGDLSRVQLANGGGVYSKLVGNERTSVRLIQYDTGNQTLVGGNQELTLAGGTIVNELGNAVDFRVETNANTHAIFLDDSADALGIFTSTPTSELTVEGDISGSGTGSLGRVHTTGTIKSDTRLEIGSNSNFLTDQLKVSDGTRDIRLNANHSSNAVVGTVGAHDFNLMTGNTFRITIDGSDGGVQTSGSIVPFSDNAVDLGSASKRFQDVFAVQTTVGAVFETGLRSKGIGKEETGTIVVWRNGKLVPCDTSEDTMVMGVVKQGKDEPIVMGAEPVLVTGDVKEGDFITTSTKLGHGKKLESGYLLKKEMFGKVIAQALENASGNSSLIKCMIRKM